MLGGKFGPGFLPISSWMYKAEYALFSVLLIAALYWQYSSQKFTLFSLLFFLLLPDIVFAGILPRTKAGNWPDWGAKIYNFTHSLAIAAGVFVASLFLPGMMYVPLLAWPLHITLDRAAGYSLRAKH